MNYQVTLIDENWENEFTVIVEDIEPNIPEDELDDILFDAAIEHVGNYPECYEHLEDEQIEGLIMTDYSEM